MAKHKEETYGPFILGTILVSAVFVVLLFLFLVALINRWT